MQIINKNVIYISSKFIAPTNMVSINEMMLNIQKYCYYCWHCFNMLLYAKNMYIMWILFEQAFQQQQQQREKENTFPSTCCYDITHSVHFSVY